MAHWVGVKKVLQYLSDWELQVLIQKVRSIEVISYLDSDFAGCLDTRESALGYIFLLACGVVSCRSAKQTLVSPSTFDVEYVGCFEATGHVLWM